MIACAQGHPSCKPNAICIHPITFLYLLLPHQAFQEWIYSSNLVLFCKRYSTFSLNPYWLCLCLNVTQVLAHIPAQLIFSQLLPIPKPRSILGWQRRYVADVRRMEAANESWWMAQLVHGSVETNEYRLETWNTSALLGMSCKQDKQGCSSSSLCATSHRPSFACMIAWRDLLCMY